MPRKAPHAVDTAQSFVLDRIARSIRRLGPPVEVKGLGDLTLGDRKFAGSAQRRLRRHFMVHASILYRMQIESVARYTRLPLRQPGYRARRSHEAFLTNLDLPRSDLLAAIRAAWPSADGSTVLGIVPDDLVRQLVMEKFGDPAWVARL